MVQLKSKSFFRELKSVFPGSLTKELDAHVARLAVLYEDLRTELYGTESESIETLDLIDRYRSIYFLRRSIATLREFAEECRLLNECTHFQAIKDKFNEDSSERWGQALAFFKQH